MESDGSVQQKSSSFLTNFSTAIIPDYLFFVEGCADEKRFVFSIDLNL